MSCVEASPLTVTSVPIGIPASFLAGDAAVWDDPSLTSSLYGSFDSTSWTLTYYFSGPAGTVSATAAAQGAGFRTTLTAANTTALKVVDRGEPDTVNWYATVSDGTSRYTILQGVVAVQADPSVASVAAEGSFAQQMVTLYRTAIKGLATGGIKSYAIQGRVVTRSDLSELNRDLAKWEARLWQEQHPGQLGPRIVTRFVGGL